MAEIFVSIGSNINREHYISSGIRALQQTFGTVQLSPVYESVSVGFEGDNFYNLAARFETDMSIAAVNLIFDEIEDQHDRDRSGPRFSSRTLDIDLLLYDDVVSETDCVLPRPEIYKNAFVLCPLADIAPDHIDPIKKQSYREMWKAFETNKEQELWIVPFSLND